MSRRQQLTLISNGSATSADFDWPGGDGVCYAEGTFAGATLTLQTKSPNGTYMTVGAATTFTANGAGGFTLPAGAIRMLIAGGPPSAIFAFVVGVPVNG